VSRSADKPDIFVVGTDSTIYTAACEPAFADGWHGWWNLMRGRAAHRSFVTGTTRRQDFLDVLAVSLDGRTAALFSDIDVPRVLALGLAIASWGGLGGC
jgi:hypothetical protein